MIWRGPGTSGHAGTLNQGSHWAWTLEQDPEAHWTQNVDLSFGNAERLDVLGQQWLLHKAASSQAQATMVVEKLDVLCWGLAVWFEVEKLDVLC